RERAVLLRAGGQLLLVGVAPGSVRLLSALADPPAAPAGEHATPSSAPASAPMPSFRDLLRRSLGR
ncbi:MAG: flagellar biosynthetic protein FliO, partial [Gammaproteobacteria bacterium]|nr:flagellar biosynthetic protein FliO [Gammaproteobacteria bacterium]